MVTISDIRQARARLNGVAVRTPLIPLEYHRPSHFSQNRGEVGHPTDEGREEILYLKPENLQAIGAFKIRGAYNKIASLTEEERARGVITYSSGNHAQGVAYAARALNAKAVIVMPADAPAVKRKATETLGAEVVYVGPSGVERMVKAQELAAKHGYTMVPPYDDEQIIAGQGTVGLEIVEDLPDVDLVLVPVGGGGVISGIATAVKLLTPSTKIIGVEPEVAADAQASLHAGEIVKLPAEQVALTAADGLRAMYVGTITFEHIRRYVDDIVTVSEKDIIEAVRILAKNPRTVAEPSGAVAPAAWLFHRDLLAESKKPVALISGGNIDPDLLEHLRKPERL